MRLHELAAETAALTVQRCRYGCPRPLRVVSTSDIQCMCVHALHGVTQQCKRTTNLADNAKHVYRGRQPVCRALNSNKPR